MNPVALVWIILFACAALMFFGIAGIISVLGFRDLRSLLSKSGTDAEAPHDDAPSRERP